MFNYKDFYPLLNESTSQDIAKAIDNTINTIDENLGVHDFAKAIAYVLKDQYGSHNYQQFITTLKNELNSD